MIYHYYAYMYIYRERERCLSQSVRYFTASDFMALSTVGSEPAFILIIILINILAIILISILSICPDSHNML